MELIKLGEGIESKMTLEESKTLVNELRDFFEKEMHEYEDKNYVKPSELYNRVLD